MTEDKIMLLKFIQSLGTACHIGDVMEEVQHALDELGVESTEAIEGSGEDFLWQVACQIQSQFGIGEGYVNE